jgi:polyribonucleotide nucleotidyltransferase
MDFKVAGTRDGITATQMDIKVDGLPYEILAEALEQARKGRLFILDKMMETITEPRADFKPHVPRIVQITIPKDMIGAVIGPGGKVIQQIQSDTGATIIIEEVENKGVVDIFAVNEASITAALDRINKITEVPEAGKIYKGIVKSIVNFGAFIEILPGKEGLLHISEFDWKRINQPEDVFQEGDEVEVKLIEIDARSGNLKLSRKALLPRPERSESDAERHDRSSGERHGSGGRGRYDDRQHRGRSDRRKPPYRRDR